MLFTRLFNFFKGFLLVCVTGRYPERLLNLCTKNNILVWDIARGGENVIYFKISRRGFCALRKFSRKTDCRIHIVQKYGAKQVLMKYKKRKWFLLGILVFVLVMFTCDRFVWKIEIVGADKVDKNEILSNLKECGLKKGAIRGSLDEKEIKNEMLIKMPELSWIWPNLEGARVIVEVKEKSLTPEIFNPESYKNIIAFKDGIIESMVIKSGNPMVKIGDTVLKGDVLVSGIIESDRAVPTRYVQAEADVFARVWYEKTRAFSTNYVKKIETGRVYTKRKLNIWGLEIKLYKDEEPEFLSYTKEDIKWEFSPFGLNSAISITGERMHEVYEEWEKQSAESVAADAVLLLGEEIEKEALPDSKRVSLSHSVETPDEDTVIVTVNTEYIENISQKIDGAQ